MERRRDMSMFIIDPETGALTVEGMDAAELQRVAGDLLGHGQDVNCARPLRTQPKPEFAAHGLTARVAGFWHGSVVEGPGRRSVLQLQGCPIRCPGCFVPQ